MLLRLHGVLTCIFLFQLWLDQYSSKSELAYHPYGLQLIYVTTRGEQYTLSVMKLRHKCHIFVVVFTVLAVLYTLIRYSVLFNSLPYFSIKIEIFPNWTTSDPHDTLPTKRVYLYSAVVAVNLEPETGTIVHVVAFRDGFTSPLICCVRLPKQNIFFIQSVVIQNDFHDYDESKSKVTSVIYQCKLPFSLIQLREGSITVTATDCPHDIRQYLPIEIPAIVPGGLALCGNMAVDRSPDAQLLVEWFELHDYLGVDKILIYDTGVSDEMLRIFYYYQQTQILSFQSIKRPGIPWGHDFEKEMSETNDEEKNLILIDCRLRLAGYKYVMFLDIDEIIVPRAESSLTLFFQKQFSQAPRLAGLMFEIHLFVEDRVPVDMNAQMYITRFINSTGALSAPPKYVYLSTCVNLTSIHGISPSLGYSTLLIPPNLAVVHRYGACPRQLAICDLPLITENFTQHFKDVLLSRVAKALINIGLTR